MSEANTENESGFKIVRNPDAPVPIADNIEFNYEAVSNFVMPRAFGSMIVGSLGGLSSAYIAGEAVAMPFYVFGIAGAVVGTTFHTGSYALRYYRKQDDLVNYASCGAIHGLVIGCATKGYRRGGIMGIGCGVAGAAYYVAGNWFYNLSRRAWINHKKNAALSVPKEAMVKSHPYEPRLDGLPPIPNRYTPVPDDDHSWIADVRRYLQKLDREEAERNNKK